MIADFLGIRVLTPSGAAAISKGDPRPCPQCGSSEIKLGHLGRKRFIAAIEPWHGNQVVVYIQTGGSWRRNVIEDSMVNGHALAVGDLDGDGRDEIIAGFRGQGHRLFIFKAQDANGARWKREILDDSIAAADCKLLRTAAVRLPSIVCAGASTGNVRLYAPEKPVGRRR